MQSGFTTTTGSAVTKARIASVLALAVVAISLAAALFIRAEPTHALAKAGIRLALASLLLSPWVLRAWRRGKLSRRFLGLSALAGVFYAIHFGAWVSSLEGTSITASVTLVTATPLLLAIWSLVTGRDRPTARHWAAIGLALVGVSIVTYQSASVGDGSVVADMMALIGAAGMAGYLLTARRVGKSIDIWAFSGLATGVGALSLWIVSLAANIPFRAGSMEALGFLLLAALVPQLIGHSALTWVLQFRSPTIVGIATVGEPVGATLVGFLWLGLGVDLPTVVGCIVTMVAVLVALYEPKNCQAARSETRRESDEA